MKFSMRIIILATIVMLLVLPGLAFAHGMDLILEEPGVLRVEYEGGGFSPRTEVTIYDMEGNELGKGLVDDEGRYLFDQELVVARSVANDGMGHVAEYREGVEERTIPKLPVVIAVFALVALIWKLVDRRSKNTQ